jgi:hypothetical protein
MAEAVEEEAEVDAEGGGKGGLKDEKAAAPLRRGAGE